MRSWTSTSRRMWLPIAVSCSATATGCSVPRTTPRTLLQETLLRAWRSRDRFDPGRGSLRTWLHRIATNASLDALKDRRSRPLPSGVGDRFDDPDATFVDGREVPWLLPIPVDPATRAVDRGRYRLAFVAALQLLPPRQRAVLLLREVLQLPADEVAEALDSTVAGVNSALQRARGALARARVDPGTPAAPPAAQRAVVDRYLTAFERADIAGIVALLAESVILEMPPMWNWYAGPAAYAGFMERVYRTRGTRWSGVPLWANARGGLRGLSGRSAALGPAAHRRRRAGRPDQRVRRPGGLRPLRPAGRDPPLTRDEFAPRDRYHLLATGVGPPPTCGEADPWET